MTAKRALVFLALLATAFSSRAGESVTIEPPAPASYSAAKPAYLYFKKIVITRQSKTTYSFDITLQGDLPHEFPQGQGADYFIYFDFDNVTVEHPEVTNIPGFSDDMSIKLCQRPGDPQFTALATTLEIRHKVYAMKVGTMGLNGNNIFFTAECPYFGRDIQTNVVLYACNDLKSPGKNSVNTDVSRTRPFDLNTGALLPGKSQEKPEEDTDSGSSLGSLLKP